MFEIQEDEYLSPDCMDGAYLSYPLLLSSYLTNCHKVEPNGVNTLETFYASKTLHAMPTHRISDEKPVVSVRFFCNDWHSINVH